MGVHVLTIESETFISDLRIRPIKQQFTSVTNVNSQPSTTSAGDATLLAHMEANEVKFTWNLEIRRLKKEDNALYYCVLNSENSYGQIYKLNVLREFKWAWINQYIILYFKLGSYCRRFSFPLLFACLILFIFNFKILTSFTAQLIMMNKSETLVYFDQQQEANQHHETARLVCKYNDLITNPAENIKWYLNKNKIKSANDLSQIKVLAPNGANHEAHRQMNTEYANGNRQPGAGQHFTVVQTVAHDTNTTTSTLYINNLSKSHLGRYRCQYRGLYKTVRLYTLNGKGHL
jgi:hypothetical protein